MLSLRQCARHSARWRYKTPHHLLLRLKSNAASKQKPQVLTAFEQLESKHARLLRVLDNTLGKNEALIASVRAILYSERAAWLMKVQDDTSDPSRVDVAAAKQIKNMKPLQDAWDRWKHMRAVRVYFILCNSLTQTIQ